MRVEVKLPDLGEDAGEEAKVSFWYFELGEEVKEGDDLVEMVTDKATFNVPAPGTGKLAERAVDEGDMVKVGDFMAAIESAEA